MSKIAFLLLIIASNASGFAAPRVPLASRTPSISTRRSKNKNAPLFVGYTPNIETEDDARFILRRAKQCAYDDTCNVEDCEIMLREMIHLQSGCVTGTLVGHDLCDEQDVAADVVAHLRAKVQQYIKDHRKPHPVAKSDSMVPWVLTELTLGSLVLIMAVFWTTLDMTHRHGIPPATAAEWWSSVRNGYLADLTEFYFRNGNAGRGL